MEREKQMQLARVRGEEHIGSAVVDVNKQRKQVKLNKRLADKEKNRQSKPVHR